MDRYIIRKDDMNRWVEALARTQEVLAPTRVEKEIFFAPTQAAVDLNLLSGTAALPYLPAKDLVLPHSENLFHFTRKGGDYELTVPEDKKTAVILGIRSCDASGISWMDKFYQENLSDCYYWQRRNNLTLVTMACNQPVKNCFCVCCEGGPFLDSERDEFDIQLVDLQDSYLVECKSSKGKALIEANSKLFAKADPSAVKTREALEDKSRKSFPPDPTSYMSTAIRRITSNAVTPETWTELGEKCFDCGGCAFVCPCCSCFGVGYLNEGEQGCHYRFWDSCDYSGFTREVSGHNPRGEKGERFKRRFFHKLSYQYFKRDGRIGCVGCGRCITACPGEVSMPSVVERLRK